MISADVNQVVRPIGVGHRTGYMSCTGTKHDLRAGQRLAVEGDGAVNLAQIRPVAMPAAGKCQQRNSKCGGLNRA